MPLKKDTDKAITTIRQAASRLYGEYVSTAVEADGSLSEEWETDLYWQTMRLQQLVEQAMVMLKGADPDIMRQPLDSKRLERITSVVESATPGPWHLDDELPRGSSGGISRIAGSLGEVSFRVHRRIHGDVTTVAGNVGEGSESRIYGDAVFTAESRLIAEELLAEVYRLRAVNNLIVSTTQNLPSQGFEDVP